MSATIGNIEEAARAIVGMSAVKPKIISTNIQKEIEIIKHFARGGNDLPMEWPSRNQKPFCTFKNPR